MIRLQMLDFGRSVRHTDVQTLMSGMSEASFAESCCVKHLHGHRVYP